MAVLRIRKLEPETIRKLECRAKRNGRTLEAEVLEIIRTALDEEDEKAATTTTR